MKAGHDHFGPIDVPVNSARTDFWGATEEQDEFDYRTQRSTPTFLAPSR